MYIVFGYSLKRSNYVLLYKQSPHLLNIHIKVNFKFTGSAEVLLFLAFINEKFDIPQAQMNIF
jgi:hypothetical protein